MGVTCHIIRWVFLDTRVLLSPIGCGPMLNPFMVEHSAPSVRALKIFDITQVTATEALQFRHAVLGPG
jgi:hypothetical protein